MREIDRAIKLSRRGLLKGSVVTGATVLILNGAPLILGRGNAWAMELKAFSPQDGATLLRFTRDLFPHDQLIDAIYASALAPLDAEAAKDPATKSLISKGIADLDARAMKASGRRFAETPDEFTRVAVMKQIENTAFFQKVFSSTQTPLYNNRDAWPKFGFEGPSSPEGGYLHRGFNDLDWL
ncbi:MAG TPA: gluconate 2-dehydrogenase subunit 3 family protein [Alphaproteobacteria bacterium]|nr:gluconate 2-dehydrogenase subunit 3 family protein [Alphaproteobacteria bacterium]